MRHVTLTELLELAKQLPDPSTYKWKSINIGDVRFHQNTAGDGWQINNPLVVDKEQLAS